MKTVVKILFAVNVILSVLLLIAVFTANAEACTADIARIDSDVYVRNFAGDVVGSLKKGDNVYVTGSSHGWNIVRLGDEEYKVWHEYMTLQVGVNADEVRVQSKPRKSKSGGKTEKKKQMVSNKTEHSIKGSIFDGKRFW